MGDYRANSYAGDGRMQMERYRGPSDPHDFRSYSTTSYASSSYAPPSKDLKFKKGKSVNGSSSKSWIFNDPEFQRKRRVASYKVYSVEGKVKGSFRKSFKGFKDRYSRVIYGWL